MVSARFPPSIGRNQMEVNVEVLGVEGISEDEPQVTFVGTVTDLGQSVTQFVINSKLCSQPRISIDEKPTHHAYAGHWHRRFSNC
jgi:hypothetical protein